MKRKIVGWLAGLSALAAIWAGAQAAGIAGLPPIPPDIAARLPKYCRYELDLGALPHPHAMLLRTLPEDALTCPFKAGSAEPVTTYVSAAATGCAPAPFPGLKVIGVEMLDGRRYRQERLCATGPTSALPPPATAQGGRTFLISSRRSPPLKPGDFDRVAQLSRVGAPVVVAGEAVKFGINPSSMQGASYLCLQMLPGAPDAMTFLQEAGLPIPPDSKQRDITGRACDKALEKAAGKYGVAFTGAGIGEEPQESLTFSLSAPEDRPPEAVRQRANQILAGRGVAVPEGDVLIDGFSRVARLSDGGYINISGGVGLVSVRVRAMSPELCRTLFDLAKGLDSNVGVAFGDFLNIHVGGDVRETAASAADAADLCALIKPSFDEWQARAPERPADLSDTDGLQVMFGRSTTLIPQAPTDSRAG